MVLEAIKFFSAMVWSFRYVHKGQLLHQIIAFQTHTQKKNLVVIIIKMTLYNPNYLLKRDWKIYFLRFNWVVIIIISGVNGLGCLV